MIIYILILLSCWFTAPLLHAKTDGPPRHTVDVANIPDAIPQTLPRSRYGNPPLYTVFGRQYEVMHDATDYKERGTASWYGTKFHQQRTSSGEPYDMFAMTAAHKTLPLPSYVRVTHVNTGKSIVVKVNDRGPFHDDRIIDLSYVAAKKLGITEHGTGLVDVEILHPVDVGQQPASPYTTLTVGTYLQAGAFSQALNAERLADYLRQHGDLPVVLVVDTQAGNHPLYQVKVGPITSATVMQQMIDQLSQLGIQDVFPVILSQQL
jgi:peptidoglycan lytic transglycosylase